MHQAIDGEWGSSELVSEVFGGQDCFLNNALSSNASIGAISVLVGEDSYKCDVTKIQIIHSHFYLFIYLASWHIPKKISIDHH